MALKKNLIVTIAVFAVFSGLLLRYLDRVPPRHYCDFRVYHHTALKVLKGQDIYFRDTLAVTPFKYSPFFAFCFAPFGLLPIKLAASFFFALNFILAIALFYLASEVTQARMRLRALPGRKLALLYGLGALFLLRFIFLVWDSGQVTILMDVLLLAGLVLLFKGKDVAAGACIASAILIKYTPVIFVPYLILRKQFKAAVWTMVFVVVFLLLPALAVGIQKETAYLSSWIPSIIETSLDKKSFTDTENQSLISMAIRFFSDSEKGINVMRLTFAQGKSLGCAFAACLYVLVLIPPFGKQRDQRMDYALLFSFLPLFNPNGWLVNFVALAVPYSLLIGYLIEIKWKDRFVVICVFAGFVLTALMAHDIVGKHAETRAELLSNVTIGALYLVAALLKLKFGRMNQIVQAGNHKEKGSI